MCVSISSRMNESSAVISELDVTTTQFFKMIRKASTNCVRCRVKNCGRKTYFQALMRFFIMDLDKNLLTDTYNYV